MASIPHEPAPHSAPQPATTEAPLNLMVLTPLELSTLKRLAIADLKVIFKDAKQELGLRQTQPHRKEQWVMVVTSLLQRLPRPVGERLMSKGKSARQSRISTRRVSRSYFYNTVSRAMQGRRGCGDPNCPNCGIGAVLNLNRIAARPTPRAAPPTFSGIMYDELHQVVNGGNLLAPVEVGEARVHVVMIAEELFDSLKNGVAIEARIVDGSGYPFLWNPSSSLQVNGQPVDVSSVKGSYLLRKLNASLDISSLVIKGSNSLRVSHPAGGWSTKYFCVTACRKLTVGDVAQQIRSRSLITFPVGRDRVKRAILKSEEDGISMERSRVSLLCPLSLERMVVPARGIDCQHTGCFDLASYLQMEFRVRRWKCPLCSRHCARNYLVVDEYMERILKETSADSSAVDIHGDASWTVVKEEVMENKVSVDQEIVCLSSGDDEEEEEVEGRNKRPRVHAIVRVKREKLASEVIVPPPLLGSASWPFLVSSDDEDDLFGGVPVGLEGVDMFFARGIR